KNRLNRVELFLKFRAESAVLFVGPQPYSPAASSRMLSLQPHRRQGLAMGAACAGQRAPMLGKDKRAGLSSNLLGAKDQPAATDEVAARAQRLLKRVAAARQPAETPAEEKAPAETRQEAVEEAAPAAVSPEPAKAAGEPESADLQETVLYRKGAASASGFRPWYWSYERDNAAPPPDGGAAVMPFPLNPPHAANPAPAPAAPAAAEASDED